MQFDWRFGILQISPVYASVYVASMLFPALATIFKEKIFGDAKQKLGGKQLDIFVVSVFSTSVTHASLSILLCAGCDRHIYGNASCCLQEVYTHVRVKVMVGLCFCAGEFIWVGSSGCSGVSAAAGTGCAAWHQPHRPATVPVRRCAQAATFRMQYRIRVFRT